MVFGKPVELWHEGCEVGWGRCGGVGLGHGEAGGYAQGSVSRREAGGLPREGAGGAGAGARAAVVPDGRTEGESCNARLLWQPRGN